MSTLRDELIDAITDHVGSSWSWQVPALADAVLPVLDAWLADEATVKDLRRLTLPPPGATTGEIRAVLAALRSLAGGTS